MIEIGNNLLGLTFSEMGLDPFTLSIVVIAGMLFVFGFIKSSNEMDMKELMDYYTKKRKKNQVDSK